MAGRASSGRLSAAVVMVVALALPAHTRLASAAQPVASVEPVPSAVSAYGDAANLAAGSGQTAPRSEVVAIASTPDGDGYWLVTAAGAVTSFGDAHFYGSLAGTHLDQPIVAITATPNGDGYTLAAADGGIFTFGNAHFYGSGASSPDSGPAVGLANTPAGYWIAHGGQSPIPAISAYVASRSDNVTVAIDDLTDGSTYTYRPGLVEQTASTMKVDILATLLRQAQAQGRGLTVAEQSLAVPMIEDSLDSAADILWGDLGPGAVGATEADVGMTSTRPATDGIWGASDTTATDRLAMIRDIVFPNGVLTDSSRSYLLYLMEHITPSQDWGITGGVPPEVTVALKNGFAIIDGWQINSAGWVDGQGRNYLIAVLTNQNSSESYGINTVNSISAIVWNSLG